ncbi:hypothetical protein [Mycobacteroides abscessus]|uniref:hypothetical protein n=1 Tax=Mycobacteroides abscessus TaxID=36809 RepID=UPI0009D5A551|nr:hypothetical protein [Mycobacteroides abscessus]SKZ50267.1 Uncharacterised protein [Mycobacteroides abscessus subsp. abscessus]
MTTTTTLIAAGLGKSDGTSNGSLVAIIDRIVMGSLTRGVHRHPDVRGVGASKGHGQV